MWVSRNIISNITSIGGTIALSPESVFALLLRLSLKFSEFLLLVLVGARLASFILRRQANKLYIMGAYLSKPLKVKVSEDGPL